MVFRLKQERVVHRIGNLRHEFLTGEGAALVGGRWNSRNHRIVYAAEHLSLAILEYLVNAQSTEVPVGYGRVEITLPRGVTAERVEAPDLGLPQLPGVAVTRKRGDQWLESKSSLLLLVPAFPVHGLESNVLINPAHPDFSQLTQSQPEELQWDPRLFPHSALARR